MYADVLGAILVNHNPRVAVGVAGVVDEASRPPDYGGIHDPLIIDPKQVVVAADGVVVLLPQVCHLHADELANIPVDIPARPLASRKRGVYQVPALTDQRFGTSARESMHCFLFLPRVRAVSNERAWSQHSTTICRIKLHGVMTYARENVQHVIRKGGGKSWNPGTAKPWTSRRDKSFAWVRQLRKRLVDE